jgi:hypothetical protein
MAIVLTTTDMQLLYSVEGLKMPIIDLTVPLVGFYSVIPLFVIALHFNLLQNLESHHNKLMRWQEAHPEGKVPRTSIQPFLFDYAVLETEGQMVNLVSKTNSLLCLDFAPITFGLLLIRYSDCQDWLATLFHCSFYLLDVWLVAKFRLAMKNNTIPQPVVPTVPTVWRFICGKLPQVMRNLFHLLVLIVTFETVIIGTPDSFFVAHIQPKVQPIAQASSQLKGWIIRNQVEENWLGNVFVKFAPLPLMKDITIKIFDGPLEWILPRIAIDPRETIWQPDEKALQTEAKLPQSTWAKYFEKKEKGFLPTTRSLRFAKLQQQNLQKAQFKQLHLQGADMYMTQLQGAKLIGAQLQGASLVEAQLQGAFFYYTMTAGVQHPGEASVFNLFSLAFETSPLIDKTKMQSKYWVDLLEKAGNISDVEARRDYRERITWAKQHPSYPEKIWREDNSPALVQETLVGICQLQKEQSSRLWAARNFRDNFINQFKTVETLLNNSEYKNLLKTLDTSLCTLNACKDLSADIEEGLDCTVIK